VNNNTSMEETKMTYKSVINVSYNKEGVKVKAAPVDISEVIPANLSGEGLLQALVAKYGNDLVSGWAYAAYTIELQRVGRAALAVNPETVSDAILSAAKGDMAPKRRVAKPRKAVNPEEVKTALAAAGLKGTKLDSAIADLLALLS
jgi:hypothetical protein